MYIYEGIFTGSISPNTVLDGLTISGGNAIGSGTDEYGGGVYILGDNTIITPLLKDCIISKNSANFGGGIFNDGVFGNCSPTLLNCSIESNYATQVGGGICNDGVSGVADPIFINCTVSGNLANSSGDAMYNLGTDGVCSPSLTNCILWANGINPMVNSDASPTLNHSIYDDGSPDGTVTLPVGTTGSNNLDADPEFVDASNGNYTLLGISPAINAGINDSVPSWITTDLAGNPRISFNNTVDMGAYEWQLPEATTTEAYIIGSTSVVIGWALDSTLMYKEQVWYREVGTSAWTKLTVKGYPTNSFLIKNLTPDTQYEYRFRVLYGPSAIGPWSDMKIFTTYTSDPCSSPEGTFARYFSSGDPTRVHLVTNYEPDSDSDINQVRWRELGTTTWSFKRRTNSGLALAKNLTPDTEYEFQWRARCSGSWTPWATVDTFKTLSGAAPRPSVLRDDADNNGLLSEQIVLNLAPNPTSDLLMVSHNVKGIFTMTALDALGRVVISNHGLQGNVQIPVNHLKAGVYLLQITDDKGNQQIEQFVKM